MSDVEVSQGIELNNLQGMFAAAEAIRDVGLETISKISLDFVGSEEAKEVTTQVLYDKEFCALMGINYQNPSELCIAKAELYGLWVSSRVRE